MKNLFVFLLIASTSTWSYSQQTITIRPDAIEGKDAFVFDYYPNVNYGMDERLDITAWTESGTPYISRVFLEFDLSQISSNSIVNSAYLNLYHNNTTTFYNGIHSGNNAAFVRKVASQWDENTINWSNQPAYLTANQIFLPQSSSGTQHFTNLDVTVMVHDMVTNPSSNFGFVVMLQDETPYNDLIFASSDHQNWNLHPMLEVTYTELTDITEKENYDYFIYPNPFNSYCVIKNTANVEIVELQNMQAQKVRIISCNGKDEIVLDRDNLKEGIYIVKLYTDSGTTIQKRLAVFN